MYNADKTGLAWRALPTNTLAMRSEKEASGYKLPKDRLTVMVCTNGTGTHKLPLLVIGKSAKPRCFKNVSELPVKYVSQKSAWMDREIFHKWFTEDFIPDAKARRVNDNDKILLILDNAPSHPKISELNDIDQSVKVVYLPPNVTALVQPMDQGVIENLKRAYKQRFLRKVLLASEDGSHTLTNFIKAWNVLECCRTLSAAWDSVSETAVSNSWKKLGSTFIPTAPTVETRPTTVGELVDLANLVSPNSNFTEQEISYWLEDDQSCPTFRILSDDEIVHSVGNYDNLYESKQHDDSVADESDNDVSELNGSNSQDLIVNSQEAATACKKLFVWLSGQKNVDKLLFDCIAKLENFIEETEMIDKGYYIHSNL